MANFVSCSIEALKAIRGDKSLFEKAYQHYMNLYKAYIENQMSSNSKYLTNSDTKCYYNAHQVYVKIKDLQLLMKKVKDTERKKQLSEEMKYLQECQDFKQFEKGTLAFHKQHRPYTDKRTLLRMKKGMEKKYDSVSAAEFDINDFNKIVTIEDTFEALLAMIHSIHDDDGIKVMYDDRYVYGEFKSHGFYGPSIKVCGFMLEACSVTCNLANTQSKPTKKVTKRRGSKLKRRKKTKEMVTASPSSPVLTTMKLRKKTSRKKIVESSDDEEEDAEWNDDHENVPELENSNEKEEEFVENRNDHSQNEVENSEMNKLTEGSSSVVSTDLTELLNAELLTNLQNAFVMKASDGKSCSKENVMEDSLGKDNDSSKGSDPDGGSRSSSDGAEKRDDTYKEGEGDDVNDDESSINRKLQDEILTFNSEFVVNKFRKTMSHVMMDLYPTVVVIPRANTFRRLNVMTLQIMDVMTGMCFFRHIKNICEDLQFSEAILSVFGDCGFPSLVSYFENGKGFNRARYDFNQAISSQSHVIIPMFDDCPFGSETYPVEDFSNSYLLDVSYKYSFFGLLIC